jgi:hydroxycarboxylate dehydrogenase B
MTDHLIDPKKLEHWVTQLWLLAGSNPREAQLTAEHLVQANLTGHDSHGVQMIVPYVDSFLAGGLQLNQSVSVELDHGGLLKLNGHRGMGQAVTEQAMAMAIERAKAHGVCIVGLRNSHHLGRVGHWAEQATQQGLASIHFTNVRATPIVAPHGGAAPRFVTNPFTVGLPRQGKPPILLDFATSAIAAGKVRVAMNKGVQAPAGVLIDHLGQPTQNPHVLFEEPLGALLTAAGHKGYGMAVMCELLAGALLGEPTLRHDTKPTDFSIINNMFAVVFDPLRFNERDAFEAEAARFENWLKDTPLAPESNGVLLPGEPETLSRAKRAQGITLDGGAVARLDDAAQRITQWALTTHQKSHPSLTRLADLG